MILFSSANETISIGQYYAPCNSISIIITIIAGIICGKCNICDTRLKGSNLGQFFDPAVQIIGKGQPIVFVNPDAEPHHLVIKSNADWQQVFDTGELKTNQFVSYNFSDYGNYTIESTMYPHMKGSIIVTNDIATFSKPLGEQNIEVQLSRSPANLQVNQET